MMYSIIDTDRLINLKVVAKLKRGQKLNTRLQHYTIEPPGILSPAGFVRWVNGESRRQTIQALDNLVSSCVYQNNLQHEEKMALVEQLYYTAEGIKNLVFTYVNDDTTVSGLELILQKIYYFIQVNGGFCPPNIQIYAHQSDLPDIVEEEVEGVGSGSDDS